MRLTDVRRCDRGTQLAELALVLPLLLFISLGIIEGSSFIRVHQIINNAAREGARLSSLPENKPDANGTHTADIAQAVVDYASRNGVTLPAGNVTIAQNKLITPAGGNPMSASEVVVTYGYPIQYISNLPWFNVPPTVNLKATAEFVNFY
jgi:Flp pilus assembly protein TadG